MPGLREREEVSVIVEPVHISTYFYSPLHITCTYRSGNRDRSPKSIFFTAVKY